MDQEQIKVCSLASCTRYVAHDKALHFIAKEGWKRSECDWKFSISFLTSCSIFSPPSRLFLSPHPCSSLHFLARAMRQGLRALWVIIADECAGLWGGDRNSSLLICLSWEQCWEGRCLLPSYSTSGHCSTSSRSLANMISESNVSWDGHMLCVIMPGNDKGFICQVVVGYLVEKDMHAKAIRAKTRGLWETRASHHGLLYYCLVLPLLPSTTMYSLCTLLINYVLYSLN